jgi:hypothetical protein
MYKLINTQSGESVIRFNDDGSTTSFTKNESNTDYQDYLAWVEAGNTPEPTEEQLA